ncbi:unnamed protein product [Linum trigynum]|uniref:Uncharacterized protein n=1 Tax=Linum trigynum TaxID=586398 RepID=A0AAV2DBQ7_9ROSI
MVGAREGETSGRFPAPAMSPLQGLTSTAAPFRTMTVGRNEMASLAEALVAATAACPPSKKKTTRRDSPGKENREKKEISVGELLLASLGKESPEKDVLTSETKREVGGGDILRPNPNSTSIRTAQLCRA